MSALWQFENRCIVALGVMVDEGGNWEMRYNAAMSWCLGTVRVRWLPVSQVWCVGKLWRGCMQALG